MDYGSVVDLYEVELEADGPKLRILMPAFPDIPIFILKQYQWW
jgi:hypothetical protein